MSAEYLIWCGQSIYKGDYGVPIGRIGSTYREGCIPVGTKYLGWMTMEYIG